MSLLALGITIWQARLSRTHNKLSVRPHLAGHSSWTEDGLFKFIIRNDGLGPARITAGRVYRDGVLLEGEGPDLVTKAFDGVPGCELVAQEFFYPEFVLPATHCIEICTVKFAKEISDIDDFLAGHLALELDYKSAYDEPLPMYSSRKL
ncbi:hypothetical protein [Pseudomonas monteilii]|uniref:hypothetical protein n=1 Tax=Pseudomonas monteilii TaxID=76759 RepID=UPI00383BBE7D